jgi:hypothetical protein
VTAFEVIEHVPDWPAVLEEARRVLHPLGQFVISTPNRLYYEESRRSSGPNPYHEHEFDFAEFRGELSRVFPHVSFFLQNHAQAIVFRPIEPDSPAECRIEGKGEAPEESNFFVAVCALVPQVGSPTYLYLPTAANVLREREIHIRRLEDEVRTKDAWIDQINQEKQALLEMFRLQTAELEARNRWAEQLDRDLKAAYARVSGLQDELAAQQAAANTMAAGYEARLAELEADLTAELADRSRELAAKCDELARCVTLLDQAEQTVEERTRWALSLDAQVQDLQTRLGAVQVSRWYRLGRTLGLGPEVRNA